VGARWAVGAGFVVVNQGGGEGVGIRVQASFSGRRRMGRGVLTWRSFVQAVVGHRRHWGPLFVTLGRRDLSVQVVSARDEGWGRDLLTWVEFVGVPAFVLVRWRSSAQVTWHPGPVRCGISVQQGEGGWLGLTWVDRGGVGGLSSAAAAIDDGRWWWWEGKPVTWPTAMNNPIW